MTKMDICTLWIALLSLLSIRAIRWRQQSSKRCYYRTLLLPTLQSLACPTRLRASYRAHILSWQRERQPGDAHKTVAEA